MGKEKKEIGMTVKVKTHGELGDYVYVRSDKQFKLNVKD